MKQATKQQQDAKTSAAAAEASQTRATKASETSAKRAPGKRKANPEQAKPATGNGNSIYQKIFALRGKNKSFHMEFRHRAHGIKQPHQKFYIPKKIRPAGQKQKNRPNACTAPRRAKHPATRILYTKKCSPCGAQNITFPMQRLAPPPRRTAKSNRDTFGRTRA